MGNKTSTLHKDLRVFNRLYGSLASTDASLPVVNIGGTNYLQKYIGTLPQGALLVPQAMTALVDTAFSDAGAQVTVGTATNATAFTAAADITVATTGWYPGVAASFKAGIGPALLAADTDVYLYFKCTAGTTIAAGSVTTTVPFVHSLDPTLVA